MQQTLDRFYAKDLLPEKTEVLWESLKGDFILVFDDGEIVTNERETIYSSYVWDYHRAFPATPLKLAHHIQAICKGKEPPAGAHLKLISNVYWDVYECNVGIYTDPTMLTDRLSRMAYEVTNEMYNELSLRCEAYVTSMDVLDFLAITKCHDIEQALTNIEPSEQGMETAQKLIQNVINDDPRFRQNAVAIATRTGLSRLGQTLQILGPRGFLTDMDSNIFRYPIMNSYMKGVRSLYDSMIESRSAAKSLANSDAPLKNAEYFSRRQQLICQNVRHLHFGDCGSQNYLLWPVRGVRYNGTTKISNGDLKTIVGKYYLDEETNTLKVVKASDTHLVGKTIKMRSVIAGCKHPDAYGVCMTCYGEAGLGIPARSNLGHIACVSMTAIIGQLILSTKHFDGSSVVEGIVLKPHERTYLAAETNGNSYLLSDKLRKKKRVHVRIPTKCVPGLTDLKLVDNVAKLNITRTSEFEAIGILTDDGHAQEFTTLEVSVNARNSSLTHDFLAYVKRTGYTISDDGLYYEFDMKDWDYSKAAFVLPMAHFNMSDHQG